MQQSKRTSLITTHPSEMQQNPVSRSYILKRGKDLLESEFQETLIRDSKRRGINVVGLHGGTFDLIVEGKRSFVCEIKKEE